MGPIAINGEWFASEGLNDEVADNSTIVCGHSGPVRVENTSDPDVEVVLVVIVEEECLGHALGFVITSPWPDRIDFAPIFLGLWVDFGVSINLRR